MHDFKIWDSHVHLFPPEIYQNWEKYAVRDNWFALLTKSRKTAREPKKPGPMPRKLWNAQTKPAFTVLSCRGGTGMTKA